VSRLEPGSGRPAAGPLHRAGERCAWSLVWLGVMIAGLDLWGSWSSWPPGGYLAPLVVLIGIAGVAWTWVVPDPRSPAMPLAALASTLAATLGTEGIGIHVRQYYTTDSGAFNQVAARLFLHGHNPYTSTMASASQLLHTPSDYWTYTVAGGHVNAVSYPAGSFLLEVPVLFFGFLHQTVDWVDLVAWLVTGALVFVLLPASMRWVGPLLVATPIYADIFSSGGTDAVFLPFLVLAVWRWDRFAQGRGAGPIRWMGPIALGLACSVKQTPWFCVPFLAVGLFIEARASGRRGVPLVAGYLAVVVAVFTAVNLPFIIWQPTAWARGTLLPLRQPLVADGQGLVTLALHGVAQGVSLPMLSVAAALVYLALLGALVAWYPGMKRIWLLVLPLVFFVAPRSLLSYLLDLLPAAIVAAVTVATAPRPALVPAGGRWKVPLGLAALVPAAAAVVVAVLAFSSPPLRLDVRSFASSHAATSLDAVTVDVHNATDQSVVPHFMVTIGSAHPDGFWHTASHHRVVLGPHASAVVTLYPPAYAGAPSHGSFWLVAAYTSSPEALSTTPLQLWRLGKADESGD
jgi:uncharacterized membrane protein